MPKALIIYTFLMLYIFHVQVMIYTNQAYIKLTCLFYTRTRWEHEMNINNQIIRLAQSETGNYGKLHVQVLCALGSRPIDTANVEIYSREDPNTLLATLSTDISGNIPLLELPAPPLEYSMVPADNTPYSEYIIVISAPGVKTVIIDSAQIFPGIVSTQKVSLPTVDTNTHDPKIIIISPNYLSGAFPPKVEEETIKYEFETGEITPIIIPEYVIVHDGIPSDILAENYYVEYRDYIKNVVSSISYPTWPEEALYSIILSVMSFTLNRMYTNWYVNQGYNFNITSSTAFDQLWVYGRNTYLNVNIAVDYMFNLFIASPGISQPLLTQICRGTITDCPDMLSLWGSKIFADTGYDYLFIIRYYFGDTVYISSSNDIGGVQFPWGQQDLSMGSTGENVSALQNQLNIVSKVYMAIPLAETDGNFGPATEAAVKAYQTIFNEPITGVVGPATYYSLAKLYTRLTRGENLCV